MKKKKIIFYHNKYYLIKYSRKVYTENKHLHISCDKNVKFNITVPIAINFDSSFLVYKSGYKHLSVLNTEIR